MLSNLVASVLVSAALLTGQLVPARSLANSAAADLPTGSATATGTSSGTTTKNLSRGRCFAYSNGYSKVNNDKAIAKSVVDVAAYVCGDGPEDTKLEEEIAQATAAAYTISVTQASVGCTGEGDVDYHARAYAKAVAAADLWLEAYANATAASGDCQKCSAFADSWGYVKEHVFLKAVSESEAIVDGYSDATSFKQFIDVAREYDSVIKQATATAFARAVAGAKKYHKGSECFAWVNAGGCIWTPDAEDPDQCFDCVADSKGLTNITEIDALAEASAAAGAFTCGTNTTAVAEAYVAASALAEAAAQALSYSYASCATGNGAYACSFSSVEAKDAAKAVAEAFAEAWAEGYTCDDTCTVKANTAVKVIGDILVEASTSALTDLCAEAGEQWTVEVLTSSIEKGSLEALAEAIAEAVVGKDCYAAALVDAIVQ